MHDSYPYWVEVLLKAALFHRPIADRNFNSSAHIRQGQINKLRRRRRTPDVGKKEAETNCCKELKLTKLGRPNPRKTLQSV